MLSLLYLGAKLLAEKGAENKAQYELDKKYREISKMELWEGMEKQVYDRLQYDKYATLFPDEDRVVYWGGDRNKAVMMSLRTIQANKAYHNSGLPEKEFLEKYFLDQYNNHKAKGYSNNFNLKFALYDDEKSYKLISGYKTHRDRNGKYSPAILITKWSGSLEVYSTIFLDDEE